MKQARVAEGMSIVDLGAGAGHDAILAARMVGPSGSVVALDFTQTMLEVIPAPDFRGVNL